MVPFSVPAVFVLLVWLRRLGTDQSKWGTYITFAQPVAMVPISTPAAFVLLVWIGTYLVVGRGIKTKRKVFGGKTS